MDLTKRYTTKNCLEVKLFQMLDDIVFGAIRIDDKWESHTWEHTGESHKSPYHNLVEVTFKVEKITEVGYNEFKVYDRFIINIPEPRPSHIAVDRDGSMYAYMEYPSRARDGFVSENSLYLGTVNYTGDWTQSVITL